MNTNELAIAPNIVSLPTAANVASVDRRARVHRAQPRQRFKILPFTNRAGSASWRVAGITRTGERVRENYHDQNSARCRQAELEAEYLARASESTTLRSTRLSEVQTRLAETVFPLLERDDDILVAVNYWREHGQRAAFIESPRLDDAVPQYLAWLDAAPFRDATKRNWKNRMRVFRDKVRNVRVSEIDPDFIDDFLKARGTSPGGRDTDRRAVSRFFSWCIERPRRWATSNPCREVRVEKGESAPPSVLTVQECRALLKSAEAHKDGLLVPYFAAALFCGLRPFEVSRLTWQQVNLTDREIRLEANQAKTKRPRVVSLSATAIRWLKDCKGREFFPANWRKEFDAVKLAAGFGTPDPKDDAKKHLKPWPADVLRHTGVSHHFREGGSYGLTAEWAGNSEAIIKRYYQGRVSSADTKSFNALAPSK